MESFPSSSPAAQPELPSWGKEEASSEDDVGGDPMPPVVLSPRHSAGRDRESSSVGGERRSRSLSSKGAHRLMSRTYSSGGGRTYDGASRRSFDESVAAGGTEDHSRRSSAAEILDVESRGGARGAKRPITWTRAYTTDVLLSKKGGDSDGGSWHKLMNLEQLFQLKILSAAEYTARRDKLINELTGTVVKSTARGIPTSSALERAHLRRVGVKPGRILGEIEIKKDQVFFFFRVPNWDEIKPERAIRHSCTIIDNREVWTEEMRWVKLATNPFDHGSLRYVYYLEDLTERVGGGVDGAGDGTDPMSFDVDMSKTVISDYAAADVVGGGSKGGSKSRAGAASSSPLPPPHMSSRTIGASESSSKKAKRMERKISAVPPTTPLLRKLVSEKTRKATKKTAEKKVATMVEGRRHSTHVAKIAIDPFEPRQSYFVDVAMQKYAQRFADMFNTYKVPKRIGFLDCWVYELMDRTPQHVYCGVEKLIHGDYKKYTNNWDWVNDTVERNTPQSFSHFTFEASEHRILICDLQGVGDLYTDPQMHTHDGKGCGQGNMGERGIEKFLSAHKCNAICTFLRLPKVNPQSDFAGTLPAKRCMDSKTIDTIPGVPTEYTIPEDSSIKNPLLGRKKSRGFSDDSESAENAFGKFIDDEDGKGDCCLCMIL